MCDLRIGVHAQRARSSGILTTDIGDAAEGEEGCIATDYREFDHSCVREVAIDVSSVAPSGICSFRFSGLFDTTPHPA